KDEPKPHAVGFGEIYRLKPRITSLTVLWDTNSYHVDVSRRHFVINGGRRISMQEIFKDAENVEPIAVRRHTKYLTINNDQNAKHEEEAVTFLVGLEGMVKGEKREILVHISPGGTMWMWKNKR
ncbi:MAG: hypothetical protein JRI77_11700, partial [Deltaproteobacteria bacterium]|nr:hypothetical protein [Deltaproteobacteria bacterium]